VEVALLPAFEFGVFCDGDCDYFAGPPFNFGGRVHANGNLFLAAKRRSLDLLPTKFTAVGQVIISQLENGTAAGPGAGSYNGNVYIPKCLGRLSCGSGLWARSRLELPCSHHGKLGRRFPSDRHGKHDDLARNFPGNI